MCMCFNLLLHAPIGLSQEWVAQFQVASQASFFQFTPSEMANVIWAFAKLGAKLPAMWLDNFLMVAQVRGASLQLVVGHVPCFVFSG